MLTSIVNKFNKDVWVNSWSRLWGWTKVAVGALLLSWSELLTYLGDVVSDPNVKTALDNLRLPAYMGLGLALLGFVTLAARSHKDA